MSPKSFLLTGVHFNLSGRGPLLLLVAILALSAYTHLWNPAGFPVWHFDEGIYIGHALDAMEHKILSDIHDHPFLGWTMLAGFLHFIGYPDSIVTSTDPFSPDMIYGAPRILMGLLAVLDTFLIYKIAEKGFGRRAAPIAAALFAVMPVSLMLRMVLLDSILLPFILSSILLAMHARGSDQKGDQSHGGEKEPLPPVPGRKTRLLIVLSGVCMGCAILTKIPSFAMIPLVLVLVWSAGKRPERILTWLVPVILIAAAWPASAALEGELDQWINGVLWQADRDGQRMLDELRQHIPIALVQGQDPDILTHPAILLVAAAQMLAVDPIMMSLGTAGLVFAAVTRNRFLILWVVPVLLFFGSIGYVAWFHLGMLWTAMCVAAAALIHSVMERTSAGRWGPRGQRTLLLATVLVITALGLSTSGMLVHWDAASAYSEAISFTLQRYAYSEVGILTEPFPESAIPGINNFTNSGMYVTDWYAPLQKTKKIVMIDSASRISGYRNVVEATSRGVDNAIPPESDRRQRYLEIYDGSGRVAEFESPPKPDTLIPSMVLPRVEHGVDVAEWNPPGWVSLPTYGPAGRALHLDGTAYVTLAATPGLDLGGTDQFSIAFWIKILGSGDPDSPIISKADAAGQRGIVVWNNPNGKVSLRMADDASNQIKVNTFSDLSDGRWHHVVFTYDGSGDRGGLDVYVDGQIDNLRGRSTSLTGSAANDHLLAIGAGSTGKGPAQDTTLDGIMIYSTRLPAGYISGVHECHVEMATVPAAGGGGDHACMGDYDDALLVHLEFEGDLSDSSGGGGGTAHGSVRHT